MHQFLQLVIKFNFNVEHRMCLIRRERDAVVYLGFHRKPRV